MGGIVFVMVRANVLSLNYRFEEGLVNDIKKEFSRQYPAYRGMLSVTFRRRTLKELFEPDEGVFYFQLKGVSVTFNYAPYFNDLKLDEMWDELTLLFENIVSECEQAL